MCKNVEIWLCVISPDDSSSRDFTHFSEMRYLDKYVEVINFLDHADL